MKKKSQSSIIQSDGNLYLPDLQCSGSTCFWMAGIHVAVFTEFDWDRLRESGNVVFIAYSKVGCPVLVEVDVNRRESSQVGGIYVSGDRRSTANIVFPSLSPLKSSRFWIWNKNFVEKMSGYILHSFDSIFDVQSNQ